MALSRQYLRPDLLDLVLRLPWWVGLLCAFASYLLLHPLAILPSPTPGGMFDTALVAVGRLLAGFATVAQYLIPLGFLAVVVVTAFLGWKRHDLRLSLASNGGGTGFRALSNEDMESLVKAAYRSLGFQVRKAGDELKRAGFDLELTRGTERWLLHLRNWKSSSIGAAPLKELRARLRKIRADGLLVLISGRFSPDAQSYAADRPIELVDGHELKALVLAEEQSSLVPLVTAVRRRVGKWQGTLDQLKRRSSAGVSLRGEVSFEADDGDAHERALGTALGALIRDESHPGLGTMGSRSEAQPRRPSPLRKRISAPRVQRPRHRTRPRIKIPTIRATRIADITGMLLCLGLAWAISGWFNTLPAEPADTPWSLLGRARDEPASGRAHAASGYASVEKDAPPFGQLDYGPALTAPPPVDSGPAAAVVVAKPKPVEVYHSIRELENAFNAKYVLPPVCYDRSSPDSLARCGNHRIRARRAFIASNGQSMVPSEPPAWGQPVAPQNDREAPSPTDNRQLSWEDEPDWRRPPPPVSAQAETEPRWESEPEPVADWRSESAWAPEPIPDWRYPPPPAAPYGRPPPPGPAPYGQDWYPGAPPAYSEWSQEPDPRQWQSPDAQPVEEWPPRDSPPPEPSWYDEEMYRKQYPPQDDGAWRQNAEAPGSWNQPPVHYGSPPAYPDPRGDWRQWP